MVISNAGRSALRLYIDHNLLRSQSGGINAPNNDACRGTNELHNNPLWGLRGRKWLFLCQVSYLLFEFSSKRCHDDFWQHRFDCRPQIVAEGIEFIWKMLDYCLTPLSDERHICDGQRRYPCTIFCNC